MNLKTQIMKQVLSKNQVNANLENAGNLTVKCYKVEYSHFNNEPYYYFTVGLKALLIAFGKKVYYHELNGENIRTHKGMPLTFDEKEYVPLLDKDDQEKILIHCGLIQPKKVKEQKPEERIKQICGGSLSLIYKMMLGLHDVTADLIEKEDRYNGKFLALHVTHSNGSFSFPIDGIAIDQDNNDEAQNIFFNALNLPVTSKQKVA